MHAAAGLVAHKSASAPEPMMKELPDSRRRRRTPRPASRRGCGLRRHRGGSPRAPPRKRDRRGAPLSRAIGDFRRALHRPQAGNQRRGVDQGREALEPVVELTAVRGGEPLGVVFDAEIGAEEVELEEHLLELAGRIGGATIDPTRGRPRRSRSPWPGADRRAGVSTNRPRSASSPSPGRSRSRRVVAVSQYMLSGAKG